MQELVTENRCGEASGVRMGEERLERLVPWPQVCFVQMRTEGAVEALKLGARTGVGVVAGDRKCADSMEPRLRRPSAR